MLRLFQTMIFAGVAVASASTVPQTAFASAAALFAPTPSVSCTVTQVDASHYDATVTWKGVSAISIEFLDGSTVVGQTQFGHPTHSGSITVTAPSAPTTAVLNGKTAKVRATCSTST